MLNLGHAQVALMQGAVIAGATATSLEADAGSLRVQQSGRIERISASLQSLRRCRNVSRLVACRRVHELVEARGVNLFDHFGRMQLNQRLRARVAHVVDVQAARHVWHHSRVVQAGHASRATFLVGWRIEAVQLLLIEVLALDVF